MPCHVTRRFLLSGLAAGAVGPAFADAPLTSPRPRPRGRGEPAPPGIQSILEEAGLGGAVGFLAVEAGTGRTIEALQSDLRLPPASVAKAATAYYTLSNLGAAHRFETSLEATGPVVNGRIEGDLILRGSGDPTFDTDAMGAMIKALKEKGIHEVTGAFRIDASALPALPFIDPDQPDHVSYNPALSGLNLNYNRVHFEWKRGANGYDASMEARALRFSPAVRIAQMEIVDRPAPVYTYETNGRTDLWTVAKGALGKGGSRWLPVRRPADYSAEVFLTLARSYGIALERGPDAAGVAATPVVSHASPALSDMLADMLRWSTNLTAEVVGMSATASRDARPESLIGSARHMNLWLNKELGARAAGFVDHSGLGYGSRVSPADMVALLRSARVAGLLPTLLKDARVETRGAQVVAKTGTLNFVSALAGYARAPGTPPIVFAIFTGDLPRRDSISVDQRERPPGARGWASRSRRLQARLVDRWLALASS